MELPIGPRQVAVLKNRYLYSRVHQFIKHKSDFVQYFRIPSLIAFGIAAGSFGVFFTSGWIGKNIMQFVPIYNKKYEEKDPEMA